MAVALPVLDDPRAVNQVLDLPVAGVPSLAAGAPRGGGEGGAHAAEGVR